MITSSLQSVSTVNNERVPATYTEEEMPIYFNGKTADHIR